MTGFIFFGVAFFLGTLIEYVTHRLMHAGYLFPAQHIQHHRARGARGWFWEFGETFLWLTPLLCLGFLYSRQAGIGFFLGGTAYVVANAYSHQLQHDHPERVFWLPRRCITCTTASTRAATISASSSISGTACWAPTRRTTGRRPWIIASRSAGCSRSSGTDSRETMNRYRR